MSEAQPDPIMPAMSTARRIGFVDLNLENFHANVFLKLIRGELKERGFEVAGCTALQADTGRAWAEKNQVAWFDDVDRLDGHVDCYMILAPGNPEVHLSMCQRVLPRGKTTYVDKTFAPDVKTAETIFALADRHGTAVQTTSVLRYTAVQEYVRQVGASSVRHMVAWGPGRSFGEYAIHPVEMVVSCMGAEVTRVSRRGQGQFSQLLLDFTGERTAVVNVYVNTKTDYAATVTTDQATKYIAVDTGRLFLDGASAILDFLASGRPTIDRAESLAIRRVLDEAQRAVEASTV